MIVVRDGQTPVLYRNVTPRVGGWLDVQLVGLRSNRDALGAVVTVRVTASSVPQRVEYGSVSHFLGQSENLAHFGLSGHRGAIAEVRVRWPSGAESVLHSVISNRTLVIVEPAA